MKEKGGFIKFWVSLLIAIFNMIFVLSVFLLLFHLLVGLEVIRLPIRLSVRTNWIGFAFALDYIPYWFNIKFVFIVTGVSLVFLVILYNARSRWKPVEYERIMFREIIRKIEKGEASRKEYLKAVTIAGRNPEMKEKLRLAVEESDSEIPKVVKNCLGAS